MLEMFQFPEDITKWQIVRREIIDLFTKVEPTTVGLKGTKKCFLQSIIDEIKNELKEDCENHVLRLSGITYQQMMNAGYFKINEPYSKPE